MWFRNLLLYRLPARWNVDIERLAERLEDQAFAPATSIEETSMGWVPPFEGEPALVRSIGGHLLLNLRAEKKLLPARVIAQVVKERVERIEEEEGFKPGRKQMKELKEAVRDELLPRAFSLSSDTRAWIDPKAGWLVVDSSSAQKGADIFGLLARAIERFPGKALQLAQPVPATLTGWLVAGEAPAGFTIDQDVELKGKGGKASIRWANESVALDEMARHVQAGKQCARLALTWSDRVSFVLTDKGEIKRVRALEILSEESDGGTDALERFESDMTLMTTELSRMIEDLIDALGGERMAMAA